MRDQFDIKYAVMILDKYGVIQGSWESEFVAEKDAIDCLLKLKSNMRESPQVFVPGFVPRLAEIKTTIMFD